MDAPESTSSDQLYPLLTPGNGLVVSQSESEEGEISYIIKEPVSERFVSLGEIEYFIFQQIDGKTPFEIIQFRVQKTFGAELSINQLNSFLNSLWKRGFLLIEGDESTHQAKKKGRFGGNILYLRFKAFNPDRLFDFLINKIRFLFTPGFVIFSTIVILMGFTTLFMNTAELAYDSARLFQIKTLFIMWLIILPVTILHEFAHGLTCKNFGGKVSEIGFMLMFFQPAMYCNVSDAWLFPDKNKRLWVGLAGVYFETFLWSLAILTWRVTAPETLLNYLAMIFMATSVLRIFFNLNPLIKLDGYYVLSDYLNIPNLRKRTFKYLRSRIKHFFHGDATDLEQVTRRERKIFIIYGPLAVAFTVLFLFLIITRIGGYLMDNFQGIGFLILLALIAFLFRGLVSKWLNKMTSNKSTEETIGDAQKPSDINVPKPPGKNKFVSRLKKLFKLTAIAAFFVFLIIGKMELKVAGEFVIYPTHNADLRAKVEGIIETVFVREGDTVNAGDLIASLSDRDYQAELRDTEAHINEKQASIEAANEELKYANNLLKNYRQLGRQQVLSQNQLDNAEREAIVKKNEVKETRAEISRLEAHRSYIKEQLVLLDIISPIAGVVTTPKTSELVGQLVEKGDLIVEVHQNKQVIAEIIVSEKDIADVEIDDNVVLKARAYPDMEFTGKVTAIAPKMDESRVLGEKVIRVTTEIDNNNLWLKTEMTGQGKIYCGERTIINVMSRRVKRFFKVEFWSWW